MPDPGIGMTFRRRRAKGRVKAIMAARSEIRTHQGSVRLRSARTCSGGGIAAYHDFGVAALLEVRIEDRFSGHVNPRACGTLENQRFSDNSDDDVLY
jgi:hypothetical protein